MKYKKNNLIKNVRNLIRLKKQMTPQLRMQEIILDYKEKMCVAIKGRIIEDIRNLFDNKEEDCYKLVRLGNFGSNKYIEYESNGDKINTLLIEQYLHEIISYLKDIKNGLKKSYTQKSN